MMPLVTNREHDFDRCFARGRTQKGSSMDETRGEKKRQSSRSAAKCRRLTEAEIYNQLTEALPIADHTTVYQMDRIAALRLAVTLCKVTRAAENFLSNGRFAEGPNYTAMGLEGIHPGHCMDECMDGFTMLVNKSGQLLYLTTSVADIIGFTQTDLMGRHLRDYVHTDDWNSLRQGLRGAGNRNGQCKDNDQDVKAFFRMKTALTPRGGKARKLTMAIYEPLYAYIIKPASTASEASFEDDESMETEKDVRFIHCSPFDLSSTRRAHTDPSVLISRHDMNMRIRTCDERLTEMMGYKSMKDLIGRSFFQFVHPGDVQVLRQDMKQLYRDYHMKTHHYRLLDRSGESFWTETEMLLLVQNIRGVPQKSIMCSHHVLSGSDRPPAWLPSTLEKNDHDLEIINYGRQEFVKEIDAPIRTRIDPLTETLIEPLVETQMENCDKECKEPPVYLKQEARAPFISSVDGHPLSTVADDADDADMPGLLPAHMEVWLAGKPFEPAVLGGLPKDDGPMVQGGMEGGRTPVSMDGGPIAQVGMESGQTVRINSDPQLVSSPVPLDLQLDFADVFGLNLEESSPFSVEEAERVFSQFEQVQSLTIDGSHDHDQLATPDTTTRHSDQCPPVTPYRLPTQDQSHPLRSPPAKRSRMLETIHELHDTDLWKYRKDKKTIESFEIEMFAGPAVKDAETGFDTGPVRGAGPVAQKVCPNEEYNEQWGLEPREVAGNAMLNDYLTLV